MRYYLIILSFLALCAGECVAQHNAISVEYEKRVKMSEEELAQIEDLSTRQMILRQLEQHKEVCTLYYNWREYAFTQGEGVDSLVLSLSGGGSLYQVLDSAGQLSVLPILDRLFLVSDTIPRRDWEFSAGAPETFLGWTCLQATLKGEEGVTAWFCPEIPVQVGPGGYNGLPGLVLKLETSSSVFEAVDIISAPDDVSIILPEGTPMSMSEYTALKERKLRSLGVTGEEQGVVIIQER